MTTEFLFRSRGLSLRRPIVHLVVPFALLAISSSVFALGLGELRGRPNLGENVRVEIDILGDGKAPLDSSCFRLVQPNGGDLPWLRRATLTLRQGSPRVLEIRSDAPLREPVMQLAVQLGCGNEIVKEYVILASPEVSRTAPPLDLPSSEFRSSRNATPSPRPQAPKVRKPVSAPVEAPAHLMPVKPDKASAPVQPDRILLSGGGDVGEPSLRLSSSLFLAGETKEIQEAQRDILRLEYRMLIAMNEQATTQLETAEKLRNMEATLGELQAKAGEVARDAEQGAKPAAAAVEAKPPVASAPVQPPSESNDFSEWTLYGVLLGALLGVGAWLGWRRYQARRQDEDLDDDMLVIPEPVTDPKRATEREEPGGVDLSVEPAAMGAPMAVDFELDSGAPGPAHAAAEAAAKGAVLDSLMSISATTLDEHFEASPVMELADIMLSFGRVKGAAQALQEYIDNNPQEALQPWIRLMDVYRMAGMREEFEAVARNLNQNFNVEIQRWESAEPAAEKPFSLDPVDGESVELAPPVVPVAPRPTCLEDMPRIMKMICEQWHEGDVVGYLYQLLRDNRGGQRIGFALPVVEEILFLIELRETANRMEKDPASR